MHVVGRRWSSSLGTQALVSCNVYVSAGRRRNGDLLLNLMGDAQVRLNCGAITVTVQGRSRWLFE